MKYTVVLSSLFVFVTLVALQTACTKDQGKRPVALPPPPNVCDSAKYSVKIAKLIQTSCAITDCHEALFPYGDFTNYSGLKSRIDNGRFKLRVFDSPNNPMPPDGVLPQAKLTLLKCWLDKGAPND